MPRMVIHGTACLALSSKTTPARLDVSETEALLIDTDGKTLAQTPRDALQFEPQLGRLPRRLLFPDETVFETTAFADVAALEPRSFWGRLHRSEAFHPRLAVFVFLSLIGAFAVYRYALPVLIWAAVALTPQPVRTALDKGTLQTLDQVVAEPTALSADQQEEVQAIFATLAARLPEQEAQVLKLKFRHLPGLGPNAVAMPGGTIIISDALVKDYDTDAHAGVLAHEIGHVVEEHGLKQVYRSLGIYVLVALLAGDTGPLLEDVLLEGNLLLSLSFSRAAEEAADDFALQLVDVAGYDPAGLAAFFRTLPDATASGAIDWFSTHPNTASRIERIETYLANR